MMYFSGKPFPFFMFSLISIVCCWAIMASTPLPAATAGLIPPKKVVRIFNLINLDDPNQAANLLKVHCRSESDDLGAWMIGVDQEREIPFRVNVLGTTRFSCDFSWGSKAQSFAVYDARHDNCNWLVLADGFHFAATGIDYPELGKTTHLYDWK